MREYILDWIKRQGAEAEVNVAGVHRALLEAGFEVNYRTVRSSLGFLVLTGELERTGRRARGLYRILRPV